MFGRDNHNHRKKIIVYEELLQFVSMKHCPVSIIQATEDVNIKLKAGKLAKNAALKHRMLMLIHLEHIQIKE